MQFNNELHHFTLWNPNKNDKCCKGIIINVTIGKQQNTQLKQTFLLNGNAMNGSLLFLETVFRNLRDRGT